MSRQPKHTPESVADTICHSLYTEGTICHFDTLATAKTTIIRHLERVWPVRKPRAKKDGVPS